MRCSCASAPIDGLLPGDAQSSIRFAVGNRVLSLAIEQLMQRVEVAARPRRDRACRGALVRAPRAGLLRLGGLRFPCALGRGGCRARKREGDGATPDRPLARACGALSRRTACGARATALPVQADPPAATAGAMRPADRNYNRPVRLPYPASAERLWRADAPLRRRRRARLQRPAARRAARGSAIFMHVARPDYAPTEGCIALARAHLLRLLRALGPRSAIACAGIDPNEKGARSFRSGR